MMGGEWRLGDVRNSFNRGFILRKLQKQKGGEGGMLEVEVEHSWVPLQVVAQGYQAPVGAVASLGVTMVM